MAASVVALVRAATEAVWSAETAVLSAAMAA